MPEAILLDVNTKSYLYHPDSFSCGATRQLLFDEFLLGMGGRPDQFPHGIHFAFGTAHKHGAPIFEGEEPWGKARPGCLCCATAIGIECGLTRRRDCDPYGRESELP